MAIDYSAGLNKLRSRRLGLDRGDTLDFIEALGRTESYERRQGKAATRYALGAMQEVDPTYTKVSLDEAEKVEKALRRGIEKTDIETEYRLQGSVPINVHIRGASDIDLLVLERRHLTYDASGSLAIAGHYAPYSGRGTLVHDLLHLRSTCEGILTQTYQAATVDVSGAKSIRLSGGGFRREVDVVPAHWHDSIGYQKTRSEIQRAVSILDKSVPTTFENWPFLYRAKLDALDGQVGGGLKMSIRLLKNLKNDTDKEIELSSYDIGGVMWNCPPTLISSDHGKDLTVLAGADTWLSMLASNHQYATSLMTPDHSRNVIDNAAKYTSLVHLAAEVSALAEAVNAELLGAYYSAHSSTPVSRRTNLVEAFVPNA